MKDDIHHQYGPSVGVGEDEVGVTELGRARDAELLVLLLLRLVLVAAGAHRNEILQAEHLRRGRRPPRRFRKGTVTRSILPK